MDANTEDTLSQLNLPEIKVIPIRLLETRALREARSTRTLGEYCWTLTPFAIRYLLEILEQTRRVTYLDADLWFLKSPNSLFEEFSKSQAEVMITRHAYFPVYDISQVSGEYCVQFLPFKYLVGYEILDNWSRQCLDSCSSQPQDSKFGDQKYLDKWVEGYGKRVHVLSNWGAAQGPWNAQRFPWSEATFFHFHGVRLIGPDRVSWDGPYRIPRLTFENVYEPYFHSLRIAQEQVMAVSTGLQSRFGKARGLRAFMRRQKQRHYSRQSLIGPGTRRLRS